MTDHHDDEFAADTADAGSPVSGAGIERPGAALRPLQATAVAVAGLVFTLAGTLILNSGEEGRPTAPTVGGSGGTAVTTQPGSGGSLTDLLSSRTAAAP